MGECVTRNSCHSTSEKRGELETERSSPLQNEAIPTVKPNSKHRETKQQNRTVLCCAVLCGKQHSTSVGWRSDQTTVPTLLGLFKPAHCLQQYVARPVESRCQQLQHNNSRQRPSCCRYSFSLPYFQALISRLPQESSCLFVPAVLNSGSLRWDWCDQTQKRLGYG